MPSCLQSSRAAPGLFLSLDALASASIFVWLCGRFARHPAPFCAATSSKMTCERAGGRESPTTLAAFVECCCCCGWRAREAEGRYAACTAPHSIHPGEAEPARLLASRGTYAVKAAVALAAAAARMGVSGPAATVSDAVVRAVSACIAAGKPCWATTVEPSRGEA